MERDTDLDWRVIGESWPYFGVLTEERFQTAALDVAALDAFFASGRADVALIRQQLEMHMRPPERFAAIMDFGCGVGRLARALLSYGQVTGVDISPGMLVEARRNAPQADFRADIPDGRFDWINSYLVLQHIPPRRGAKIIDRLLAVAASDACVSLHFTTVVDPMGSHPHLPDQLGLMMLYAYDLAEVVARLRGHGFEKVVTQEVRHKECAGTWLFAARGAYT